MSRVQWSEDLRPWLAQQNPYELKRKIFAMRDAHGFPFFDCKIALAISSGDTQLAIRFLKGAENVQGPMLENRAAYTMYRDA